MLHCHLCVLSLIICFMQTSWTGVGSCGNSRFTVDSDVIGSLSVNCSGRYSCKRTEFEINAEDAAVDIVCDGYR